MTSNASLFTDAAGLKTYERNGVVADASSVAAIRDEFARWLIDHVELDAARLNDVVLTANEALANSAEYAYLHVREPGEVHLRAEHDAAAHTLTVLIVDEGRWREPDPVGRGRIRGRGIPLMQAMADDTAIESTARGTRVRLRFDNVGQAGDAV